MYEHYSERVFGYCVKWLRSREEAEDAVQTTFLYAMRGLRRGIVPKFDEAWLLAIARNVCLTRTEVTRRRAVEVARDPLVLAESLAAPVPTDDLSGLSEALTGLTEAQRRAILLREWQGLSYQEIAAELDLSQAAVETLLFRARRALAARLRGAGSFLPWLKSFAGGGAGSLAVGATVLTVTAAGTVATVRPDRPSAPATGPVAQVLVESDGRTAAPELPRRRAPARAHAPARSDVRAAAKPAATPTAAGPAADLVSRTSQAPAPTDRGSTAGTAVATTMSGTTHTATEAKQALTDAAGNAVQTVVASAIDTPSAVENVATGAVAATTDAVAGTTAAVGASVPAVPTVTAAVPGLPLGP